MAVPRRCGFSLLEIMIVLILVAVATLVITMYLEPIPAETLSAQVKKQLSDLAKEVQSRAVRVPEHHFVDLRAALGGREVPLDPWGEPYLLAHASPAMLATTGPEDFARLCRGIGLVEHTLASGGPDREVGFPGEADDFHLVVKLGRWPRAPARPEIPHQDDGVLPALRSLPRTDAQYPEVPGVPHEVGGILPEPEPTPESESEPE